MKNSFFKPKYIFNALVIGLCAGIILYFFFSKDGLNDLIHSDTPVIWYWILAAVASQLTYMFLESLVIYLFIKDGHKDFRFIDAIRVGFMGLFWSAITPSSTGGQPMQVYLLYSKMHVEVGYSTSRLMQKFLVYQVVLTSISIVAVLANIPFIMSNENISYILVLLAFGFISQLAVTGMVLLFSFSPNLARKLIMFFAKILNKIKIIKNVDEKIEGIDQQLNTFHTSNKDIYKKPKLFISAFILTILQFIAMFLVPYFIFRAFGFTHATPFQLVSSQAFVNLMSGMIPIPGASGAAELGFTAFFSTFFINGTLKSAALIWRVINYYGVIALTGPFSYMTKDKAEEAKKMEEAQIDKKAE